MISDVRTDMVRQFMVSCATCFNIPANKEKEVFTLFSTKMTHLSIRIKNSVTGREGTGPLLSMDVGVFLQLNKKAASVTAAAFNNGRE